MHEQLVIYETAKLAKRKGFDEECWQAMGIKENGEGFFLRNEMSFLRRYVKMWHTLGGDPILFYDFIKTKIDEEPYPVKNSTLPSMFIALPTQDLLERWLRDTQGLMPAQCPVNDKNKIVGFVPVVLKMNDLNPGEQITNKPEETFEEAREIAIQQALNQLPDAQI